LSRLAAVASRQRGLVDRVEALNAGISVTEIKRRLRNGSLIPEFPGVYRVGHRAPSTETRYLAAVLACGDGAALRGRAAAHFFGLVRGLAPPPEVMTLTERRIEGIVTFRARRANRPLTTTWRGMPITTVPQTLVDVAAEFSVGDLARACHEAGVRYGTTPAQVEAILARRPNSPGAGNLRRVLYGDFRVTVSKLERGFLALLRSVGLPLPPQTNKEVDGRRVDCRWPEHKLTVELDGYRYHSSRHAWEQDRRREREARARGDEFRRYTYGDVFETPALMLAELHELLAEPASRAAGPYAR
jgi:very-short-patch-repair endonuclease